LSGVIEKRKHSSENFVKAILKTGRIALITESASKISSQLILEMAGCMWLAAKAASLFNYKKKETKIK